MRHILFLLWAVFLAGGCSREADTRDDREEVPVELSFATRRVRMITRGGVDENRIEDVNVWLFGRDNFYSYHEYSGGENLSGSFLPGSYDMYVVANIGEDYSHLENREDVESLCFSGIAPSERILMACHEQVSILPDGHDPVCITASLSRLVSRIDYSVTVEDPGITLHSVQFVNLPAEVYPFRNMEKGNSSEGAVLCSGKSAGGIQYMFKNMAGEVPGITEQSQKGPALAPEGASEILIRATCRNRVIAFHVFLGENSTTSFNVRENTIYTMDIHIISDSVVDTRISSYELLVEDTVPQYNGYCFPFENEKLNIGIWGAEEGLRLQAVFNKTRGATQNFLLNGERLGAVPETMPLGKRNGENSFLLSYSPERLTSDNESLEYSVQVEDDLGFRRKYDFRYSFGCAVEAIPVVNGAVELGAAFEFEPCHFSYESRQGEVALIPREGTRITCHPDERYEFLGWYEDQACQNLLSLSSTLHFTPRETTTKLYARLNCLENIIIYETTDNEELRYYHDEAFLPARLVFLGEDELGRKTLEFDRAVTSVGDNAFWGCSTLESMILPATVTRIGMSAFRGCSSLRSIKIPRNVSVLQSRAFEGCTSLESVTIPMNMKKIFSYCFMGCSALSEIDIPEGVENIDVNAFTGCSSLESITLPRSLKRISDQCFMNCTSLRAADIPSSVTQIGDEAFWNCQKMESVTLHEGLESIGNGAFSHSGIREADIPSTTRYIAPEAFSDCTSLEVFRCRPQTPPTDDDSFLYGSSRLRKIEVSHFRATSSKGEVRYPAYEEYLRLWSSYAPVITMSNDF